METEFVSELQLGSVSRAGQLPRQEGRFWWEDPFLAMVGRVGAELWSTGCSARLVGLCGSNSFFFSLQNGTGVFAPVLRWRWPSRS